MAAVLQDLDRLAELIQVWEKSLPPNVSDRSIVLAVDVIPFRPVVTITEEGEIWGLKHLNRLDDEDIFTHLLRDPNAFAEFLHERWKDAHSSLFAFHIQPTNPISPRSIIHVYPAENGKGNQEIVQTLLRLKRILETEFRFPIVGLAFDGDSDFNPIHDEFALQWRTIFGRSPISIPIPQFRDLIRVICDPLHLLKRIRYHLLKFSQFRSPEEPVQFSIERIREGNFLSPIVSTIPARARCTAHFRSNYFPKSFLIYSAFRYSSEWRGYDNTVVYPCNRTYVARDIDADPH
jgi:hypothetical protein